MMNWDLASSRKISLASVMLCWNFSMRSFVLSTLLLPPVKIPLTLSATPTMRCLMRRILPTLVLTNSGSVSSRRVCPVGAWRGLREGRVIE